MVRTILGIIAGYFIIAVCTAGSFTVAYLILGEDGAFQPGSWDVTPTWGLTTVALAAAVALIGGVVCGIIAKPGSKAPLAFAVVVIVLGILSGVLAMARPDPGPREPGVSVMDAANTAKQPAWYTWSLPFIGAAGVYLGSSFVLKKKASASVDAEA